MKNTLWEVERRNLKRKTEMEKQPTDQQAEAHKELERWELYYVSEHRLKFLMVLRSQPSSALSACERARRFSFFSRHHSAHIHTNARHTRLRLCRSRRSCSVSLGRALLSLSPLLSPSLSLAFSVFGRLRDRPCSIRATQSEKSHCCKMHEAPRRKYAPAYLVAFDPQGCSYIRMHF